MWEQGFSTVSSCVEGHGLACSLICHLNAELSCWFHFYVLPMGPNFESSLPSHCTLHFLWNDSTADLRRQREHLINRVSYRSRTGCYTRFRVYHLTFIYFFSKIHIFQGQTHFECLTSVGGWLHLFLINSGILYRASYSSSPYLIVCFWNGIIIPRCSFICNSFKHECHHCYTLTQDIVHPLNEWHSASWPLIIGTP